uniref:Uncharacterized protein n=1 Tax=Percolomonas cosmopolitus TaxID=63605 RepID=A0A6U0L338_9EUKA|mmetsp:Transcript_5924/g.22467  ORF Transcript_5924/g.22467 Transcript_5924/m.22467 type:complete len:2102 (+) Transcript_5924:2791-9096(+)|eukprot:CAMPEP_0117444134 /NCGR_PEP_ID=MMETSP0759-20121206/5072_1 /TAXON_ID=63605 /ORGANISM="Percolomonas cosmopolitus, Strain WS" /LENGTH=2101 /DNA_ID=CAMNT_0005236167 /DNA_START=51 /DNA_END=6356 /DNA_ORIENTATION=+
MSSVEKITALIKARLDYAIKMAYNKSFAEGKLAEAEKYKAQLLDKFPDDPEALEYINNIYPSLVTDANKAIVDYHKQKDIDAATRKLESSWKNFERDMDRFPDRAEKELDKIQGEVLDVFRSYDILDVVRTWEDKAKQGKKTLTEAGLRRELQKASESTKTPFSMANTELSRGRPDQVERYLEEALKVFQRNFEENSSFDDMDQELVEEYREQFYSRYMGTKLELTQLIVKQALKKDGDNMITNLSHAKMYFDRNQSQAQEYYERALNSFEEFSQNPEYAEHPMTPEYLEKFDTKRREYEEFAAGQILKKKVRDMTNSCLQSFSTASAYLLSSPGRALEYAEKGKELADEISRDEELASLPEIAEFFGKYQTKLSEFESKYEKQIVGDLMRKAKSSVHVALSSAKAYRHDFARQMDYISTGRDLLMEIQTGTDSDLLMKQTEMQEFVNTTTEEVDALELEIQDKIAEHEARQCINDVSLRLTWCKGAISGHNFQKAKECLEEAEDLKSSLENFASIAERDSVKEYLVKYADEKPALEKEISDKIFANELRDAKNAVTTSLAGLSGSKQRQEFARAMEVLDAAQDKVLHLEVTFPEAAKEFIDEYSQKIDTEREDIQELIVQNEVKEALGKISTNLNNAKTYLDSHRPSQAMGYLEQAVDAKSDLEFSHLAERPEVEKFLAEFDEKEIAFREDFAERESKQKIRELISNAKGALQNARTYFSSHNFERSKEYMEKARDIQVDIVSDPEVSSLKQMTEFLDQFEKDLNSFDEECQAKLAEEGAKQKMSAITSKLSNARGYFPNHASQSLNYLTEAKDALDDIRFDSTANVPDTWVEEMDQKIADFEAEYNATILSGEIKKAKDLIETNLRNSDGYIKSSKQTALGFLEKAEDALSVFITSYPAETDFISDIGSNIKKKQQDIVQLMQKEEIKTKKDSVRTVLGSAKAYITSHREAQALQMLQTVLDKAIDLEVYPEEKTFVESINKEVENLQNSIMETAFNEEIKRKAEKANLLLSNASLYMDRSQKDRAVDYLQQAEDAAYELADEKYIKMESVDSFFTSFNAKLNELKEKFNTILYGQEVKKAKEDILTALSNSKVYFKSKRYDQALEYLNQCKEKFDDFSSNENFINEGTFVSETQLAIEEFDSSFTETVYKNQVNSAIKKLDHELQQAQNFLKYSAFDRALSSYEKVSVEVQNLEQYASHSLAKERLERYTKDKEAFETEYAEKAMRKEANKFSSNLRSILHVGKTMLVNQFTAKVLEQLSKAEEEVNGASEILKTLPEVQASITELDAFKKQVASELLTGEADRALRKAQRDMDKLNVFLQRGLKKQASELFKTSFVDDHRALLEERSTLAALDNVQAFRVQVESVATNLQLDLKTLLAPKDASKGKKVSGDVLFGEVAAFSEIRLETIAMSTSISSKVFNAVKKYNTEAGKTNQLMRKFLRETKELNLPAGESISRLYSYEDLSRYLKNVKQAAESIPDDAKDDENAKVVLTQADKYAQWVEQVHAQVKQVETRQRALAVVSSHLHLAKVLLEKGEEYTVGGTIPAQTTINERTGNDFINLKLCDYELLMEAYLKSQEGKRSTARYAEEFTGFPQETFDKELDEIAQKALKLHVRHCMRGFTVVSTEKREVYMRALRRFPLARKYALRELMEQKYNNYVYDITLLPSDKNYLFDDPFAGQTISDAFEEKDEDYSPAYELITPADPSVPEEHRPHESENPLYWSKIKEQHCGEIIFSKNTIEKNEKREEVLTNEFVYGQDEIHARAIWRNSINNFAIAKEKSSGKFLYPPARNTLVSGTGSHAFSTELLFFVKIDGNRVEVNERYGAFFYDEERKTSAKEPGSQIDFYAWNQSMKVFVLKNAIDFSGHYETNSVCRFNRELARLAPGKHEVEIEMCYLIRATNGNRSANKPVFPTFTSKISQPISKGSFTVTIPKGAKMINLLPKRTSPLPNAAQIEQATLKMLQESPSWGKRAPKTENIVTTWATSEIYVSRRHWLTEVPIQWGTNFNALIYRNPELGWRKEELAIFTLSTYSEQEKKQIPPCIGVGVGGNITFEPDFLPEDVLKGVNRYSGHYTDVYKGLTDEDKKRYFEQPWAES